MKDPVSLIRKNILDLAPYSTARDEYEGELGVFLDANENPYDNGYNRYPDPHQKLLKQKISSVKGVPVENIFIGNGSDEAIDIIMRLFCRPGRDNIIAVEPTYGMYRVAAGVNDVEVREVMLTDGYALDPAAVLEAADECSRLLFLCSPNNPTGNLLGQAAIETLADAFPGMIVIDEAYIDFSGDEGWSGKLDRYPQVIVLQTLSKAWGMAGLRLGMAFADERVVRYMNRVKYPYNINGTTQVIVSQLLDKGVDQQVGEIIRERERVARELERCPAVEMVFPSDANFLLVKVTDPRRVYSELIAEGVIVRDRSSIPGCSGCLRVTIGRPQENDTMLKIMKRCRP